MVLSRCRPLRSTRWRLPSGWRGRARGTRWAPAIGRRCATSRRSSRLSSGTRSRGPPNARDGNAPREMAPLGIPRGCPRDRRHARGHPRRGRPRRARARRRRPRPATVCVASRTPRGRPRRRRPPRARPPRAPTEARDARDEDLASAGRARRRPRKRSALEACVRGLDLAERPAAREQLLVEDLAESGVAAVRRDGGTG